VGKNRVLRESLEVIRRKIADRIEDLLAGAERDIERFAAVNVEFRRVVEIAT
jgi:hypothetical protein